MSLKQHASIAAIGFALLLGGCNHVLDPGVSTGKLEGILLLQWNREDGFIYTPDPADPLRYARRGFPDVRPGRMYTDGGSIPRIFWSFKHYSPWAYGPAYVIHDWLYLQHRCKVATGYGFEDANAALYDVIGILVQQGLAGDPSGQVARHIKWAVDNYGRSAWNGKDCLVPSARAFAPSTTIMRFRFGTSGPR